MVRGAFSAAVHRAAVQQEEQISSVENEASHEGLKWYCEHFEGSRVQSEKHIFNRRSFPFGEERPMSASEKLMAELASEVGSVQREHENCLMKDARGKALANSSCKHRQAGTTHYEMDSDGEMVRLCAGCQLPLGSKSYSMDGKISEVRHRECIAQVALVEMQERDRSKKAKEAEVKAARREEFDIGWNVDVIPDPTVAAKKLGFEAKPGTMCCLAFNTMDNTVRVAPTFEPASAMNLEYLSLALQVRRTEGREPLFSLDPIDHKEAVADEDATMQMKRFEPEWLAGTSVGDIMFQADYLLKELSMGEHDQPVVGMRSCLDYTEQDREVKEWAGREWFVVHDASISLSEDDVLIPVLKMGVEAREQIRSARGMEDAPMTRPNHPLVKYAHAFTRNFDLIAERRSVIFQLREVAKASAMAKFMLESGMAIGEEWFDLNAPAKSMCCLEVPQLWTHRSAAVLKMENETFVEAVSDKRKSNSVYGGVDFGIDRFRMSAPNRVASSLMAARTVGGRPSSGLSAGLMATQGPARLLAAGGPGRMGIQGGAAPISRLAGPTRGMSVPFSQQMATGRPASALMATSRVGIGAPTARLSSMASPQGVDLNMDKFNLSTAEKSGEWGRKVMAPEGEGPLAGNAFWSSLWSKQSAFSEETKELLSAVFDSRLCDRKSDGALFVPPPTNCAEKLRKLIDSETTTRKQRTEFFNSAVFSAERNIGAGLVFPSSWTPSIAIDSKAQEVLKPRPDLKSQESVLNELLLDSVPKFDRYTEDGTRWLVYRIGGLEIRAIQAPGGNVKIGSVFSVLGSNAQNHDSMGTSVRDTEVITQAVLCVEKASEGKLRCQHFLVVTMQSGNKVLVERRANGEMVWVEQPRNIDDRISMAKLVESNSECKQRTTIGELLVEHRNESARAGNGSGSSSRSKRYAHSLYTLVSGRAMVASFPGRRPWTGIIGPLAC